MSLLIADQATDAELLAELALRLQNADFRSTELLDRVETDLLIEELKVRELDRFQEEDLKDLLDIEEPEKIRIDSFETDELIEEIGDRKHRVSQGQWEDLENLIPSDPTKETIDLEDLEIERLEPLELVMKMESVLKGVKNRTLEQIIRFFETDDYLKMEIEECHNCGNEL